MSSYKNSESFWMYICLQSTVDSSTLLTIQHSSTTHSTLSPLLSSSHTPGPLIHPNPLSPQNTSLLAFHTKFLSANTTFWTSKENTNVELVIIIFAYHKTRREVINLYLSIQKLVPISYVGLYSYIRVFLCLEVIYRSNYAGVATHLLPIDLHHTANRVHVLW